MFIPSLKKTACFCIEKSITAFFSASVTLFAARCGLKSQFRQDVLCHHFNMPFSPATRNLNDSHIFWAISENTLFLLNYTQTQLACRSVSGKAFIDSNHFGLRSRHPESLLINGMEIMLGTSPNSNSLNGAIKYVWRMFAEKFKDINWGFIFLF